jgi:uncharacterized protein (TIGR02145 family)
MKNKLLFIVLISSTNYLFAQNTGSFVDNRDNKVYKTIEIGAQTWMAENLNYSTDSSCCYNNDSLNCRIYGRLYSWEKAKNVCPVGWHLPDTTEWKVMTAFLGGAKEAFDKIAENNVFMKGMTSSENPDDIYQSASNSSGFSALPSGVRINDTFEGLGFFATWWTSTEASSNYAYYSYIGDKQVGITGKRKKSSLNNLKEYFSVRCLKN